MKDDDCVSDPLLRFHSVFSDSSLSSVIPANSDFSSTSKSQAPVHKNIKITHTSKTTYNLITQTSDKIKDIFIFSFYAFL